MFIKIFVIWIGLSILMAIFWIVGLMIGNTIFPSNIMEGSGESSNGSEFWLFITCLINTFAVLFFIHNSRIRGLKLTIVLFLIIFGIQYFMSQIETVWFNNSLKMPVNTILMIVTGGAIMSVLFAFFATWITGRIRTGEEAALAIPKIIFPVMLKPIALLAIVIWPMVYFLAGYFIAWQFPEIREYYSGSTIMDSFFVMMKGNVISGLYFFQIFRGILWVFIALLVFQSTNGTWLRKGIILGLLLTCLGCSQLLLPNPIMPEMVRLGHLLETSTSNFIWGIILSWFLAKYFPDSQKAFNIDRMQHQPV